MIVDVRDGKTSRGFRQYGLRASMAWFLDEISVGDHLDLTRIINVDGSDLPLGRGQIIIPVIKPKGSTFRTNFIGKTLRVWRVS